MLLSWVVAMLEVQGVVCMEHTQVVLHAACAAPILHVPRIKCLQGTSCLGTPLLAYAPCIPPLAPLTLLLPS